MNNYISVSLLFRLYLVFRCYIHVCVCLYIKCYSYKCQCSGTISDRMLVAATDANVIHWNNTSGKRSETLAAQKKTTILFKENTLKIIGWCRAIAILDYEGRTKGIWNYRTPICVCLCMCLCVCVSLSVCVCSCVRVCMWLVYSELVPSLKLAENITSISIECYSSSICIPLETWPTYA